MTKINKNDFIEIDFTGKIKNTDEIFDTTVKEDAKTLNPDIKDVKPLIISVGNQMLPEGFDADLDGKEENKKYTVDIKSEKAFGKRNPQMIKMIPLRFFHEQKINPERGLQLNIDGQVAKVLSASGGRVLVDFNNPLAGKEVTYEYTIKRKVTGLDEKIDALQEFFFRKKFEFKTDKESKTITFFIEEKEKQFGKLVELMAKPFDEILSMKVKAEIKKETKKEKSEDKKEKIEEKKE
jgi:FKBP-type peptidyl-prolyl cis-trans isomerase 2